MAVGTGFGFNVDALQKALDALDKNLEKVIKKGEDANKAFAAMFKGKDGIAFNKQLIDIKKNLELISKEKDPLKWNSKDLGAYVDQVNRMVNTVEKMNALAGTKGYKRIVPIDVTELQAIQRELLSTYRQVEKLEKQQEQKKTARNQTYSGSLRYSDKANTLEKERIAVKNLEAARAKLNKTDADYDAKLRNINNRIAEHNRNIDQATGRAKKLEQQHKKNAEQMAALKNLAGGVGRALLGMFSVQAIRGYVNQLIQVRGEFELQQKSLEVLLQNKDKADALWDKTVALAVKSPFRVKDLVTYTKQLAAYRVEADKLYDTNKMLADVSAGLGVDMGRLILAFGQVKAANFLRGTELRQFSEAGVNMLEELSKRYTELEGRIVTVGEVFDRVSKRMVSFSDVEAVFKTITSEGGTFYRMQEQQSETLKGMVMNLKDSIDLMMNEIGASNESLLKNMVETIKSLVDNWRKFATILQEVGTAFVLLKLPSIVKALGALGTTAYSTAINIQKNGIATATFGTGLSRLRIGVNALTTALFKNPLFWGGAIVTALAVATHQLISHNKEVQETNKKYDELSQRELGRIKALESLAQKSQEYNKSIEENTKKLSKGQRGTQEYADAEKDLSNARKSNEEILKRLKQEFPELYQSIKKNKNGTIELSNAIEEQNRILAINIALNEQAKAGWFHDDLATNAAQATTALNNERNALSALQASAKKTWADIISLKEKGRIKQEDFSELEEIIKKLSDAKSLKDANALVVRLREIMVTKKLPYNIYGDISASFEELRNNAFEGSKDWGNLQESLDRLKSSFLSYITIAKEIDPDKWQETAGRLINSSLEAFGIVDENLLSRVQDYIETITGSGDLTWKIKPKEYTEEDLKDWRKTIWDAIKKVNDSLGDDLGQNKVVISLQDMIELDKENVFKNLSEQVKTSAKNIDDTIKAGLIPTQERFSQEQLDAAEATKPLIKSLSDLLAIVEKSSSKESQKILNKRINLIKEMYSEYLKGEKIIGKAAEKQVAEAYANTFKEAFEGTGINLSGLMVDKNKLTELQKAGEESGQVFTQAMLDKMNEVAESGTYIRNISDKAKERIKLDEGFVGYIYDDSDGKKIKTQISTLEELYKYFDKATGKAKEVEGQGTLTIGYGHALQTLEEAKKYLGITLEQADAEELLNKDIQDRIAPLNTLLDKYNELIVTQEQYDTLFNNFYQGGLSRALRMAFSDSTSELEGYIKGLDEDLSSWGSSFAQEWGDNWLEEFKQLETKAERFAKVLEIASVTTVASGSHIEKSKFYGENAMKARSARRAAEFRGDLEVVKLLEKASIDVSLIDFTNIEGVVSILERLRPVAEKEGKEAVNTLNQAISKFKAEIGFKVKEGADKDLKAQVQELFDRYDLSLELKKLNIPSDLAKSLFGVDYLDLDGLKKAIQDQSSKFIGTDMEDEYKDFLKKIGDLQRKQQEDDAKEFVNFLKKNLNEIQVIQDKGAYNIALADRLFGKGKITAEQYVSSIRQIVEDTNKEVAKVNLDKFKDSATYIKAMGNLAAYSRDELEGMISALQGQVGANAGNMGADEIRAYYEALERLVDQYNKLESPFQKGEINDLIEYLGLQKQLNQEKEKEAALEQKKLELNARLEGLQAQLKSLQERGDVLGAIATQVFIKNAVNELKEVDGKLVSVTSNISVISEKVANLGDGMIKGLVVAQKIVNEIANIANASTKMFNDIKSAADALGADTESGGWAKAGYAMEMVGGVSSELTSGLSNLASGNFAGALANVVGVVTQLVSGFAKIHDQEYQDIIEAQAEEVERLGKAYEKLETDTESAYSIQQLQQYNEELERNVELQIDSYKAMIAAENAKKNTDTEQIEAWNAEIEALTQQWDELKQSLVEGVGGVSDYRSQTRAFVDSWVSAFKETGNGLDGLKNNFREFFDNIIAEQAAMRVTEKFLEPFYGSLNEALKDYELTIQESKNLREMVEKIAPDLSSALEKIWGQLGGSGGETGGSLSALQKGVSSLSEETGQIIEAYLNSVRGYVSEQVTHTRNIYRILNDAVHSDAAAIRVRMV